MSLRPSNEAPWHKIPLDLADCDAGRRLRIATGRRLAWMHAVAAELWAKRYLPGRVLTGADAAARYELAAEWTGRRGAFAEAAALAGFVVATPDGLRIRPLVEVVGAEWTPASPARSPDTTDKAEAERARERDRKRAKRAAAKAGQATDASRTTPDTSPDTSPDSAGHDPDTHRTEPDTARTTPDRPDERPLSAPASARETETKTQTQTETPEEHLAAVAAEPSPPGADTRRAKPAKPRQPSDVQADGEAWLARYRAATGDGQTVPRSWWARYGTARRHHGTQALLDALAGCLSDPFWGQKGPLALLGDGAIVQGRARHARPAKPGRPP
jgi:hypothetical protein